MWTLTTTGSGKAATPADLRPTLSAVAPATRASLPPLAPQTWTTTGPLVHPTADERHPIVAVKDPSVVFHDGRWHIFATTAASKGWGMAYFNFARLGQGGGGQALLPRQQSHLRRLQLRAAGLLFPAAEEMVSDLPVAAAALLDHR